MRLSAKLFSAIGRLRNSVDSDTYTIASCREISLYIHIPFCTSKCSYCDFFSVVCQDQHCIKKVITEIVNQIRYFLRQTGTEKIASVYMGGGTPSCLEKSVLTVLLQKIKTLNPGRAAEFTVEANPESMDEGFLSLCSEYGVTRLSVGIQSLCSRLRATLGRRGDSKSMERAFALLTDIWRGELNCDLMCGIPGQSWSDIQSDLEHIVSLHPDHISLYTLTLERGTDLFRQQEKGMLTWPDRDVQDAQWLKARALLVKNGYSHYEISNFALPGKECRHNMRYWLLEPYVGVGPAAVSTLPGRKESVLRLSNPSHINGFLKGVRSFWNMETESICGKDFLFEQLMLGFRLKNGIPKALFRKRFGKRLPEIIPSLWNTWCERGYVRQAADAYCLTLRGRLVLNRLLGELAQYQVDMTGIRIRWP
jgi:oxygen-independent coproporphyrinogen-3 oxidase